MKPRGFSREYVKSTAMGIWSKTTRAVGRITLRGSAFQCVNRKKLSLRIVINRFLYANYSLTQALIHNKTKFSSLSLRVDSSILLLQKSLGGTSLVLQRRRTRRVVAEKYFNDNHRCFTQRTSKGAWSWWFVVWGFLSHTRLDGYI